MNANEITAKLLGDSIAKGWEIYYKRVYPEGTSEVQKEECQKAFEAGTAFMFTHMMRCSDMEDGKAEDFLATVSKEVDGIVSKRSQPSITKN